MNSYQFNIKANRIRITILKNLNRKGNNVVRHKAGKVLECSANVFLLRAAGSGMGG